MVRRPYLPHQASALAHSLRVSDMKAAMPTAADEDARIKRRLLLPRGRSYHIVQARRGVLKNAEGPWDGAARLRQNGRLQRSCFVF
jgi:hypothetical protein